MVVSIRADTDEEQAFITIEIEDTGIGIPEKELDKIFAMYYQVKSGKDNLHAVGTGIGLAVSKQLMNLMNGDITVSSEDGFGSTFTVTLSVPLAGDPGKQSQLTLPYKHLNIFMVEDIELNVTVARSLLESMGHSVTVAMSGEEAKLRFIPAEFDLVFLDIQLPDMTGFDVAAFFRKEYEGSEVPLPPLVALTANLLKDKNEYLDKGMDDAISKPLSVTAVKSVIEKWCYKQSPDHADVVAPESGAGVKSESDEIMGQVLDLEMLNSYIDIVGIQPVLESIKMFEDMMPSYIEVLDSNMVAKDQDGIVSEAHKIKGAAGSIGLARIQRVAQKAQSPDSPAWWENITDWTEEIKNEYKNDIHLLREWINSNG